MVVFNSFHGLETCMHGRRNHWLKFRVSGGTETRTQVPIPEPGLFSLTLLLSGGSAISDQVPELGRFSSFRTVFQDSVIKPVFGGRYNLPARRVHEFFSLGGF